MANDENVNKLIGLFLYHHNSIDENINNKYVSDPEKKMGVNPEAYQTHVAHILAHTMEVCNFY